MKQTIILLHGLFGSLSNWQHQTEYFQNDFDIHVPSLPIYDEHKENVLDYMVNALHKYIEAAAIKNVILVGNSLGGHVAILYAYKYQENVKSLVLTGSSGLYERFTMGTFPRRHDYLYIKRKVSDTFYDPATATKELVDEIFETVADNRKCLRIMKVAKTTQRNYVTDILPKITKPVLLIWGDEDIITPPRVAEEFKVLLSHADLVFLPNCGYAPMMEKPKEFNMILERFIGQGLSAFSSKII